MSFESFWKSLSVEERCARMVHAASAKKRPLMERFMEKVTKTSTCWLFRTKGNRYGYIGTGVGRSVMSAHHASWLLFRGEIPDGSNVLHKCDVRACVNPDHLYLGTQADNMLDRWRKRPFDERVAKDAPRSPVFLGIRDVRDM